MVMVAPNPESAAPTSQPRTLHEPSARFRLEGVSPYRIAEQSQPRTVGCGACVRDLERPWIRTGAVVPEYSGHGLFRCEACGALWADMSNRRRAARVRLAMLARKVGASCRKLDEMIAALDRL